MRACKTCSLWGAQTSMEEKGEFSHSAGKGRIQATSTYIVYHKLRHGQME